MSDNPYSVVPKAPTSPSVNKTLYSYISSVRSTVILSSLISWIVSFSKSDKRTKIEIERSQGPDIIRYICKSNHLQELASKTHKSSSTTRATTLILHVHLKRHLGSRVNSGLLITGLKQEPLASSSLTKRRIRRTYHITPRSILLIKQLPSLSHSKANKLVLIHTTIAASTATTVSTGKHLQSLHRSTRTDGAGIMLLVR